MSTTTFSGPIRAGKIKTTTGTTLGENIFNLGQIVMAQTFFTGPFGGPSAANLTDVVIPANSQIVDIKFDCTTGSSGASLFSVGDTVGGNATFVNELAMSNGRVGLYTLSNATSAQVSGVRTGDWTDIGPVDKRLTWTTTSSSAGAMRVTVLYQQNNNLIA